MHFGIDLDDVTVDFWAGLQKAFRLEYDVEPEYDGQPWGDLAVQFYTHALFKETGFKDWWGWLRANDHLWGKVFEPIPGAIGGVKRLRAAGHYVEAVTSKPEWAERSVFEFIGRYRIPFNRVTIISNGQRKIDFTDADIIVDDKRATCEEFTAAGRQAVLFARVGHQDPAPRLYVARSWGGVVNIAKELTSATS